MKITPDPNPIRSASNWLYAWGFILLVGSVLEFPNFVEEQYYMERFVFLFFSLLFLGLGYWMKKRPSRFISIFILIPVAFYVYMWDTSKEGFSLVPYWFLVWAIVLSYEAYKSISHNQVRINDREIEKK
jgi:hypothetical protein